MILQFFITFTAPKEILSEEMTKKPCPWYQNGSCQYGLSCHNSHYTLEQLGQLQQQAYQMDYNEWLRQQPKQYNQQLIDTFMARRDQSQCVQNFERLRELWKYPEGLLRNTENVPPSLQPLNPALIPLELDQWG